ncbi:MAG TPA: alpha/beta fold hydrolase [Planctomycetota bacterium]
MPLPTPADAVARKSRVSEPVPGFVFDIEDGLYTTVTADSFPEPKIAREEKIRLKPEGFAKDIEVRVLWAPDRKPLAVLIPGLVDGGTDKQTQLWKSYLHAAGYHVLTFDSPFLPTFNTRSRHGVAGNLLEEAKLVANLVAAFLGHPKTKGRVTQMGLVGLSYGGTLALNIARMAAENRSAIRPQQVLAFSPPVSMRTAARILDTFYAENRWNYTLVDMAKDLSEHKPVPKGKAVPFSAAEMRAGIGTMFRLNLRGVVLFDDRVYKLGLLPKEPDEYRRDMAGTWTFNQFMEEMAMAYWSRKSSCNAAEFWTAGDLTDVVKACPDTVHVILAEDDPLNDPLELNRFLDSVDQAKRMVLPHGGHLGYARTEWAKNRVAKLFP